MSPIDRQIKALVARLEEAVQHMPEGWSIVVGKTDMNILLFGSVRTDDVDNLPKFDNPISAMAECYKEIVLR